MGRPNLSRILGSAATMTVTMASGGFAQGTLIDVPGQELVTAIEELSAETGKPIAVSKDAIGAQLSRPVKGPMTVREALGTMINDPSLTVRELRDGSFAVTTNRDVDVVSQNATDTAPLSLGTLVLRSELLERNLQESQTSAVVVEGEELEERSDPNISGILERTPGVTIGADAPVPSIRGVNQRGPNANGAATVSLTVDGAAISDFGLLVENGPFSVWDLEQVEILRGPQSTQSGRNALAGAINIRSRDPFMGEEFKYRLEVGNRGTTGVSFAYNKANASETLAFRLSADRRETDGFIENSITGAENVGREKNDTYRVGVLWQPNDRFSTVLK